MAVNRPGYVNGGEGDAPREPDPDAGDNPTGRARRSSARTRRKKDRRLFDGTIWGRSDTTKET